MSLDEFDEAIELLVNVRKRYAQEDLIRENVAAQGDSKSVKDLIKNRYTPEGKRPLGTKTETEFLHTFARGL